MVTDWFVLSPNRRLWEHMTSPTRQISPNNGMDHTIVAGEKIHNSDFFFFVRVYVCVLPLLA